jgi:hypothetical protein
VYFIVHKDHLRTGTRDLDHSVLVGAENTDKYLDDVC